MLYDMDAVHLDMVGHIRASFGLGSELPFAPVGNQTRIVVASSHGDVRKRWARVQCMHLQACRLASMWRGSHTLSTGVPAAMSAKRQPSLTPPRMSAGPADGLMTDT